MTTTSQTPCPHCTKPMTEGYEGFAKTLSLACLDRACRERRQRMDPEFLRRAHIEAGGFCCQRCGETRDTVRAGHCDDCEG